MGSVTDVPFHRCLDERALPATATAREREVSAEEYQELRNRLLSALRPFGTVGPMGEFPLHLPEGERDRAWHVEHDDPVYFVPDDQLSATTLYLKAEVESSTALTLPVLDAIWSLVQARLDCGVGIGVPLARYFYFDGTGVWFLDAGGAAACSVAEAVALEPVTSRPAD